MLFLRLLPGALVALALLAVGEAAPGLFPVWVTVEAGGNEVVISMEGQQHLARAPQGRTWVGIELDQPGPERREYQIDGSDVTSRQDRDPEYIQQIAGTPLYRLAAWLRDEGSYSRWEQVRLVDTADGRVVAEGLDDVRRATLPATFRVEAALRRPEAVAMLWLVSSEPRTYGGLEINRDGHFARWMVGPERSDEAIRWFFPEDPRPFAATLLQLLGRIAAAAYLLFLGSALLALGVQRARLPRLPAAADRVVRRAGWFLAPTVAFGLSSWIAVRLYHQLPHIVDAVSYYRQALTFTTGRLWLEAPPAVEKFWHYHQVVWLGRWYSQYPPGAPAAYAAGAVFGLAWLVGPLASVLMLAATAVAARLWYGPRTALATLALGALSPFVLFQAGAFMSHPIAGAALAGALAAFAAGEQNGRARWHALAGAFLGAAFLTREVAAVLFAVPLGLWLIAHRRVRQLSWLLLAGAPFLLAYLAYNAALTGDPFLLPRQTYDPADQFGFGTVTTADGNLRRHTLAAGLVNTDENLTLLQFDLFGWPPLFGLGVLGLVFLLGRATRRDLLLALGALLFPAAYVAYFYHGIVLGPRYYYEALPFLLLLAARGLQAVAHTISSLGAPAWAARLGAGAVVAALTLNTTLYYLPQLIERRMDYGAMAGKDRLQVSFVEDTLSGPRLQVVPDRSLVFVPDETVFKTLGSLNCALLDREHIQECPVLFVNAGAGEVDRLRAAFPGRSVLRAVRVGNVVQLRLGPPA